MHALFLHLSFPEAKAFAETLKLHNVDCDFCTNPLEVFEKSLHQKYDIFFVKHCPPYMNAITIGQQIFDTILNKQKTIAIIADPKNQLTNPQLENYPFSILNPPYSLALSIFFLNLKNKLGLKKTPGLAILQVKDLMLNTETREVIRQKNAIKLRNKEYALLEFLMINQGRVIDRPTILDYVWDRNINIFTNTIDVHIRNLRKKIDADHQQKLIKTIPCIGYKID